MRSSNRPSASGVFRVPEEFPTIVQAAQGLGLDARSSSKAEIALYDGTMVGYTVTSIGNAVFSG
ncbi:hypothetical protein DXO044_17875 [Xanthomonas oryzae pv. oryzae]|uniref:Uncharacterized protein n=1 Tax=Xanthomonas oryzae pv. oryzae (strain PXO99A) TaxID=360094 RepID=A0A0K0GRA0_XANOP|nr:hypothetical protein PXO_06056 [Xanthomonas oryzae pv. oryzae PXO99A]OLH23305.1 hypothetical protein DXO044_17875 [Xanthomonas oryzae pv. oryzae]